MKINMLLQRQRAPKRIPQMYVFAPIMVLPKPNLFFVDVKFHKSYEIYENRIRSEKVMQQLSINIPNMEPKWDP